ncbi:MAG: shikimate kinase [Bacteroidales bacterium]|nr:shikimate kinase [Bacteroidales bacterium]
MRPVYLIGFMGAGKTTLGKRLATAMGLTFQDLDHLFEEKYKLNINSFFEKYGENLFRKFEYELIKSTYEMQDVVISTGGGTPCFFDSMQGMNQNGVTVYMQTTPAGLTSRLVNAKRQRPLLEGKSPEELILYVTEKLKEREKWYTQAHFKIDAINPDLPKLIGEIYSLISEK